MKHFLILMASLIVMIGCAPSTPYQPENLATTKDNIQRYSLIFGGSEVGTLEVEQNKQVWNIRYEVDNNGRGSSSDEVLYLDELGVPREWRISGKTVFGNEIDESFKRKDGVAHWRSAAGDGKQTYQAGSIYIAQNASMYSPYLYLRSILERDLTTAPALPSGSLSAKAIKTLVLTEEEKQYNTTLYALTGMDLNPEYLLLDENNELIAKLTPRFAMIRQGLESEEERLRKIVAEVNVARFNELAERATHTFETPVRIDNVHIFQPRKLSMSGLKSVLVSGNQILAVEDAGARSDGKEHIIDGKGGYLVPGLYEMHGHMQDQHALLNVLTGVTSVRDMGNEISIIEPLIADIEAGRLIGPRITKSAFIEGKSPFSSASGELVSSEEEAVEAIRMYAARGGYHQIKIYNSIDGDWVPAMVAEAKKHGMRVAGHVPAFSKADEMIKAGYDEMTHINQVMLGWVLDREEDTRTLFRITGMKRFADLDLTDEKVQTTLDLMAANNVAIDPTIVIHETGLLSRNGEVRPALENVITNLPVTMQRRAKVAMLNIADEDEDQAYLNAFDKILDTLRLMHEKGIFIVPGTDLGGGFYLHRELELFTKIGMTPAEALKRGSYDMANYLGYGDVLGSIEPGKLADFFLVSDNPLKDLGALKLMPMVVKGGKVYFPAEIYPEFGITPFTTVPDIRTTM